MLHYSSATVTLCTVSYFIDTWILQRCVFNINPCVFLYSPFPSFLKNLFHLHYSHLFCKLFYSQLYVLSYMFSKKIRKKMYLYFKINLILQLHFLTSIYCCLGSKFCYINRYAMRRCLQIFEEMLCFLYTTNIFSFIYSSSSFLFYIAFHLINSIYVFSLKKKPFFKIDSLWIFTIHPNPIHLSIPLQQPLPCQNSPKQNETSEKK